MNFYAATEKRLELACRAAMGRLEANVVKAVASSALKLEIDFAEAQRAYVQAESQRLAGLGLKLSERGAAIAAFEAPTPESVTADAIALWNENAIRADDRLGFPLRMERAGIHSVRMTGLNRQQWSRGPGVLLFLATQQRLLMRSWQEELELPAYDPRDYARDQIYVRDQIEAAHCQAEKYEWMLDLLMMMGVPPEAVERQSSSRNGLWDRVIRKTKMGIAMKRAAFQRDAMQTMAENQREQLIRDFARDERRRRYIVERGGRIGRYQITGFRSDPECRDFTLSSWLPAWPDDLSPKPPKKPKSGDE